MMLSHRYGCQSMNHLRNFMSNGLGYWGLVVSYAAKVEGFFETASDASWSWIEYVVHCIARQAVIRQGLNNVYLSACDTKLGKGAKGSPLWMSPRNSSTEYMIKSSLVLQRLVLKVSSPCCSTLPRFSVGGAHFSIDFRPQPVSRDNDDCIYIIMREMMSACLAVSCSWRARRKA
jgi:hypothetical protein